MVNEFDKTGWKTFGPEISIAHWGQKIAPIAINVSRETNLQDLWLRCDGTWFAGVNVLPNDVHGAFGDSGKIKGEVIDFISQNLKQEGVKFDHAQISVCYEGYPRHGVEESEANHRYRVQRDSAHVDGLLPEGPNKRRHMRDFHGFILGIPLGSPPPNAAPFVIWEGSHHIMQAAFKTAYAGVNEDDWGDVDVTDIYQEARREVWATCKRVELPASLGESYVTHRFALHGVAPWEDGLKGPQEGRMIAYFRPDFAGSKEDWLKS